MRDRMYMPAFLSDLFRPRGSGAIEKRAASHPAEPYPDYETGTLQPIVMDAGWLNLHGKVAARRTVFTDVHAAESGIWLHGNRILEVDGGAIYNMLRCGDTTTLVIRSGEIRASIYANSDNQTLICGGDLYGLISATGRSQVFITGGRLFGSLEAHGSARITLCGYNLAAGSGEIVGMLSDGSPLRVSCASPGKRVRLVDVSARPVGSRQPLGGAGKME